VIALASVYPSMVRLNFHSGFIFDMLDGWDEVFKLPIPERIALLKDPAKRRELNQRARSEASGFVRRMSAWENFIIADTANKEIQGKTVGEIARASNKEPIDAILDIAIADNLRTVFALPSDSRDEPSWKRRAELWRDNRTVVGASDAGAHLDMLEAFAFSSHLLATCRDYQLMSLEETVRQLTEIPAQLLGLKERGLVKEGWVADLVVFDPDRIGATEAYIRNDLPGAEMRLYADPIGVDHVIVNGTPIVEDGKHTGATPGVVLRSGRDTETSTLN
jgi:N-acyl-D-aspartate/D-glutamate deacylase